MPFSRPYFHAEMVDASILHKIVVAIADVVPEVNMKLSKNGISLMSMSSDHVSIVSFILPSSKTAVWESYQCLGEMCIGLDFKSLCQVFKKHNNNSLAITLKTEQSDDINFVFTSSDGKHTTAYTVKLLGIDAEAFVTPTQEYECVFQMSSSRWTKLCLHLANDLKCDSVRFLITANEILIETGGSEEIVKCSTTITPTTMDEPEGDDDDDDPVYLDYAMNTNAFIGAKYLKLFLKGAAFSDQITVSIIRNYHSDAVCRIYRIAPPCRQRNYPCSQKK